MTIIGNLTRDPELRCTSAGISVRSFTVAVNRRKTSEQRQNNQQPEADYFNVSAWRERGEICAKYLAKGRKVCVIGPVSCRSFTRNDGTAGASLEVTADEVEFLSSRGDGDQGAGSYTQPQAAPAPEPAPQVDPQNGYQQVDMGDELPF